MRSSLFEQSNLEKDTTEAFTTQSSKMLKVTLGSDVLAVKGAMVAFQGNVEFHHEGSKSVGQFLRKMVSSDDVPLMRVSGDGEVFFAQRAAEVFIVQLEGDALSVNGRNLLAFEATLDYDISRVQGAGMLTGGAWNTTISGHGKVALIADGTPMLLDCSAQRTCVDIDAAVAWSANLAPSVVHSMNFRSLLRGGSGEMAQLAFAGPGFVVVQPSEGGAVAPHNHPELGNRGGGGLIGDLLGS